MTVPSYARVALALAASLMISAGCAHIEAPISRTQPAPVSAPSPVVAASAVEHSPGPAAAPVATAPDDAPADEEASARRAHLARVTREVAAEIPDEPEASESLVASAAVDAPAEVAIDGEPGAEEEGVEADDVEEPTAPACGAGACPVEAVRPGVRYSADIDDETLARMWKETPEALGSLSIGLPSLGRLVNARPFPEGEHWTVVIPQCTWATEETIDYLTAAIAEVARQYPNGRPLRVNHISVPNGGYLRPHQSHQSGRDVDLAFYYGDKGPDRGAWAVKHNFDLDRNWALVRALITETDLQVILVDRSIIKRLYKHALAKGEDKAWLDSVFNAGKNSLLRHARRHRDHYHVRFYNPRAQELGRRVLPLMPKDPRQNIRYHRVRKGDTIGKIAYKFGSTVKAIQRANRLKGTMIRLGQTLAVPLRGPCVNCPMPPEVIVPPRRLPPPTKSPLMAAHVESPAMCQAMP